MRLRESLKVGIIQTTVNCDTAWCKDGQLLQNMTKSAEEFVIDELRKGFRTLNDLQEPPQIVLIPEYSIPLGALKLVKEISQNMGVVVFGGLDLCICPDGKVKNEGTIIIPNNWPNTGYSAGYEEKRFGKTNYSEDELNWFRSLNKGSHMENVTYIINAGEYGTIGIAICSDFYDLERFVIYKGKIHHLFIISYNIDYKSFEFLAEAISRLLFCNVVICNTGYYGDSLAFSPYKKDYKRIIYKNMGGKLFATQAITLPVQKIDHEQIQAHKKFTEHEIIDSKNDEFEFKWPPGYRRSIFEDGKEVEQINLKADL